MDRYNLTKGIVENIVSRVKDSSTDQNTKDYKDYKDYLYLNDDLACENNRILVVFTGSNFRLGESLRKLSRAKKFGFSYDIAFSFSGANIMGEEGITEITRALNPGRVYTEEDQMVFEKIMKSVDGIIVPMATQSTTTKLALGIQDGFISTLLWQSLWHDKKILMDFESALTYNGMPSKNPFLTEMMTDYIAKLERMGVVNLRNNDDYSVDMVNQFRIDCVNVDGLENIPNSLETKATNLTNVTKVVANQQIDLPKVITESDLLKIVGNGNEIIVPIKTIITPLALDTAKKQGIKVTKR